MKTLIITNGFYWSAGDKWWPNTKHGRVGLGVEKKWLLDDKLIVNVDKVDYELDCAKAREFIKEHKSFEERKGAKIGYIPKSLLRDIMGVNEKENISSIKKETLETMQDNHQKPIQGLLHLPKKESDGT